MDYIDDLDRIKMTDIDFHFLARYRGVDIHCLASQRHCKIVTYSIQKIYIIKTNIVSIKT